MFSINHRIVHQCPPAAWALIVVATFSFLSCGSDERYWPSTDQWETASPTAHGMDSVMLDNLVNSINKNHYGYIRSLLVVKDGYLITERYFNDADTSTELAVNSITKSVLGMVWGIADANGEVPPVTTPIEHALPQYAALIQSDPLRKKIIIEDLLTMTAGVDWVENDLREGEVTNDFFKLMDSPDQSVYFLSKPMVDTPGLWFNYNSGCSMLLSTIFTTSSGKKFGEYVNKNLFNRIGIDSVYCQEMPAISNAASGLFLTSREMAKFGLLIARNGQWEQQEVISLPWIRQATSHIVHMYGYPFTTGYGYQWWLATQPLSVGIRDSITVYGAYGWGGQMIAVVPKYDLVVVVTAVLTKDELQTKDPTLILWNHILPAITVKK